MITFQNVTKRYKNDHYALKNVSLEIHSGEFVFIVGASGAGKSTLMKLLYSEEKPTSGIVSIGGINIANLTNDKIPNLRRCMGIVFQDYKLLQNQSVFDNVAYGLKCQGIKNKDKLKEIVISSLKKAALYDEVKDRLKDSALSLSGGQQQRLCIARAIALSPSVILMDEPTSALDPIATSKIEELIFELKKEFTIVIVTHNMQQAARISDYTAFFMMGEIVEFNETAKLFKEPKEKKTEDYITGRFG